MERGQHALRQQVPVPTSGKRHVRSLCQAGMVRLVADNALKRRSSRTRRPPRTRKRPSPWARFSSEFVPSEYLSQVTTKSGFGAGREGDQYFAHEIRCGGQRYWALAPGSSSGIGPPPRLEGFTFIQVRLEDVPLHSSSGATGTSLASGCCPGNVDPTACSGKYTARGCRRPRSLRALRGTPWAPR